VSEAQPFDFNRLSGIPKSQLEAVHLVHDNFARSVSSSLSAYLRSYVAANLVSIKNAAFSEFLAGLAAPTCLAYLNVKPYDTTVLLELNLELMFAFFEVLLGGKADAAVAPNREITEIEKTVVQTVLRLMFSNLGEAWREIAEVSFYLQSLSSEPQLLHAIAPAESVLVVTIEIKCEGKSGMMKLAIPSIFIKRLKTKFESLQQAPKAEATERDRLHVARLIKHAHVRFEAKIDGGSIPTRELIQLKPGDVLMLEHREERPMIASLNGRDLWHGSVGAAGQRLAFQIGSAISPVTDGQKKVSGTESSG
jgi:flagellar motor switch protein FliM